MGGGGGPVETPTVLADRLDLGVLFATLRPCPISSRPNQKYNFIYIFL